MTLKERLAQSQAKMDEMKARVAKASEKAKNARHAIAYALEAEANIFAAAKETAEYIEKYGE